MNGGVKRGISCDRPGKEEKGSSNGDAQSPREGRGRRQRQDCFEKNCCAEQHSKHARRTAALQASRAEENVRVKDKATIENRKEDERSVKDRPITALASFTEHQSMREVSETDGQIMHICQSCVLCSCSGTSAAASHSNVREQVKSKRERARRDETRRQVLFAAQRENRRSESTHPSEKQRKKR